MRWKRRYFLFSLVFCIAFFLVVQKFRFPFSANACQSALEENGHEVLATVKTEGSILALVSDTTESPRLLQFRRHWLLPWYTKPEILSEDVSASASVENCYDYWSYFGVEVHGDEIRLTEREPFPWRKRTQWRECGMTAVLGVSAFSALCMTHQLIGGRKRQN